MPIENIFGEIPATDISCAIYFYQAILEIKTKKMDFLGMEMGILPYEGQAVTDVIIKGERYQPSANGVTIYLNRGDNLQVILDKVEKNGGCIIIPKTPHADESSYFALFLDSEGNKLGLHSVNWSGLITPSGTKLRKRAAAVRAQTRTAAALL